MSNITIEERIHKHKIGKPKKLLAKIIATGFKLSIRKTNCEHIFKFDKKQFKGKPVMFLCQHASFNDYLYVGSALIDYNPCIVCGYNHILTKSRFNLMLAMDVIPKSLYHKDPYTIASIYRAIKQNRSVCLFPEGIQSTSGSGMPIQPGTEKLLKKLNVPVIMVKSYGGYLTRPRFSKVPRIGKITYTYEILFTPEELKQKSIDELYTILLKEFEYNDIEYNKKARIPYIGKVPNASGLDKILYRCPKCESEFELKIEGDKLVCGKCGNSVLVNKYYDLIPLEDSVTKKDIDVWYKWQRVKVREQIQNPSFHMSTDCYIQTTDKYKLHKTALQTVGEGNIILNHKGLTYVGTINGKNKQMFFPIEKLPSIPFSPGIDFDVRCDNDAFTFVPKTEPIKVVKWMLACEELHKLTDEVWKSRSEDAKL